LGGFDGNSFKCFACLRWQLDDIADSTRNFGIYYVVSRKLLRFFFDNRLAGVDTPNIGAYVRGFAFGNVTALGHLHFMGCMAGKKFWLAHRLFSPRRWLLPTRLSWENCSFIKRAERICGSLGTPGPSA
jgi:hypothetical protein